MRRTRGSLALVALLAAATSQAFDIPLDGWTAKVDPATMAVTTRLGNVDFVIARASSYRLTDVVERNGEVSARLAEPDIKVRFTRKGAHLSVRFDSAKDVRLEWPGTGAGGPLTALILPQGEGLYLPQDDLAWMRRFEGKCLELSGNLSMPFWSYTTPGRTLTYHVAPEPRSELCLSSSASRMAATLAREFRVLDGNVPLEIDIGFGDASPIAPALEHRARLIEAGTFKTLAAKIERNAEIARLLGAQHFYVWGDGRTPAFITDLAALGLRAAWVGYDQDEFSGGMLAGPDYVKAARNAGFLVGPYDSWANAMDPTSGDMVSRWPGDLWRAGCIVKKDGTQKIGFAGRGCELSSEALARAERTPLEPIAKRMDHMLRDGANSYFLDVDAFGELHDDYSPAHPMSVFKDRENRLARMAQARGRGVVLGSEQGAGWSVPLIDFAHGATSVYNDVLWANHKKKNFGAWWPPDRPGIFFKTIEVDAEFRAGKYDPAFRLPLYEAAFHDALVATERWDTPMNKFPALAARRQLLDLLYGTPSIWAADRKVLVEWREPLAALAKFFEALHRRIALQPLRSFEWLTADRLVQRTRFGESISLTANFGTTAFDGLGSGCLRVAGVPGEGDATFCPVTALKTPSGVPTTR
jgi:glycosyl hydrolase family 129